MHVCAGLVGRSPALAAGVTWRTMWTSRTTSAPWGGRIGHTTVIDAAGAIYVIGGFTSHNGTDSFFNDVWVSTDRGAGRTRAGGVARAVVGSAYRVPRGY